MRIISIIVLVPALFIVLNYFIPHIAKKWWRKHFLKWANDSSKIYLTFDDGPEITNTGLILDILKIHGIRATFFVIGINVEKNPFLVQRMIKEGHTIGIHGYNHLHPWKVLPWKAMEDLSRGKKILEKNGVKTCYVRPPYGKLNMLSLIYIFVNRLTFIHWHIDPQDYNEIESVKVAEFLKKEMQRGKVILLHDGRCKGTYSGDVTVNALSGFLENTFIPHEIFVALPINGLK
jgi:peptidoglycan-N-acetylglucosamine deacetylase